MREQSIRRVTKNARIIMLLGQYEFRTEAAKRVGKHIVEDLHQLLRENPKLTSGLTEYLLGQGFKLEKLNDPTGMKLLRALNTVKSTMTEFEKRNAVQIIGHLFGSFKS